MLCSYLSLDDEYESRLQQKCLLMDIDGFNFGQLGSHRSLKWSLPARQAAIWGAFGLGVLGSGKLQSGFHGNAPDAPFATIFLPPTIPAGEPAQTLSPLSLR